MVKSKLNATTDSDIDAALRTLARVIERYGETYWPIFERLENELQVRRSRVARMRKYRTQQGSYASFQKIDDKRHTNCSR